MQNACSLPSLPFCEADGAMQYGRQVVPISVEQEDALQYLPDKGFELIGFVEGNNIPPRHYLMKVCPLAWS